MSKNSENKKLSLSKVQMQFGKDKLSEFFLTLPSYSWLIIFFVIPSILVFAIAFKVSDAQGGIGDNWSFETISKVFSATYAKIAWRTVWVSLLVTIFCLLLAIPVGYWISKRPKKWQSWLLLLVIIPLWTNFLIRIFAWRALLHPDGIVRSALLNMGLIGEDVYLLNNICAVILVTIYTFLPFAILPIYAASERFDFSLMEAARDLGASRFKAFKSIYLRGISRGIITAFLIVFIPSLGSYAIPDLVGGIDNELLGNRIALRATANRNLPEAAAIAVILAIIIVMPLCAFLFGKKRISSKPYIGISK